MEQLQRQLASARDEFGRSAQTEASRGANDVEQTIDSLRRSSLEVELAAKEKEVGATENQLLQIIVVRSISEYFSFVSDFTTCGRRSEAAGVAEQDAREQLRAGE